MPGKGGVKGQMNALRTDANQGAEFEELGANRANSSVGQLGLLESLLAQGIEQPIGEGREPQPPPSELIWPPLNSAMTIRLSNRPNLRGDSASLEIHFVFREGVMEKTQNGCSNSILTSFPPSRSLVW